MLMDMVSLHSEADYEALEPDSWGIPTPTDASITERKRCLVDTGAGSECESLDMIIMPGVAFDDRLARLGHGKGFYDFFLQRYERNVAAANRTKMPFLGKGFSFFILRLMGYLIDSALSGTRARGATPPTRTEGPY